MTDTVILVHGLWFGAWSLKVLDARLRRAGFRVHRFSWATTRRPFNEHVEKLSTYCRGLDAQTVHLAGHSMGGLLILRMLGTTQWECPGRVLLMGTPLHGSAVARRVARWPLSGLLLGHAAETLAGTDVAWPSGRETGMISGTLPVGLGRVAGGLERPNDGTVAVAETHHPGLTQRVEMHVSHTGMLYSRAVARQAAAFLESGHFLRKPPPHS